MKIQFDCFTTKKCILAIITQYFLTRFVPMIVLSANVTASQQLIHIGDTNILDHFVMSVFYFSDDPGFVDIC